MIVRDRVGDVLQQHGLAGARRRHDKRALALADRRDDVDDPRREILFGRILEFHLQPLVRIERRQIVEVDLVPRLFGILEIERVDLEQREVALAFLRAADVAVDGVAGAQAEAADLRRRDVDIVRPRQIIRLRRAQKAEAVRQNLDDAFADNVGFARRELLEDTEHQLLLAHGAGVLDLELLGERDKLRRSLVLSSWSFISRISECPMEIGPATELGLRRHWRRRRSQVLGCKGLGAPDRCIRGLQRWSQNSTASAYVRWDGAKIGKDRTSSKGRRLDFALSNASTSERFHHHQKHDRIINMVGTSLIIL